MPAIATDMSIGRRNYHGRKRRKKKKQTVETVSLEKSRIANIYQQETYSEDLNRHAMQREGSTVLNGEVRNGLESILSGQCPIHKHIIKLQTSWKLKGPQVYCQLGV